MDNEMDPCILTGEMANELEILINAMRFSPSAQEMEAIAIAAINIICIGQVNYMERLTPISKAKLRRVK